MVSYRVVSPTEDITVPCATLQLIVAKQKPKAIFKDIQMSLRDCFRLPNKSNMLQKRTFFTRKVALYIFLPHYKIFVHHQSAF